MNALLVIPYENKIPVWQDAKTGSNCRALPTLSLDLSLMLRSLYFYREHLKRAISDASSWKFIRTKRSLEVLESYKAQLSLLNDQILMLEGMHHGRQ